MHDLEARLIALVQQHAEAHALWQTAQREAQVAGDRCHAIEEQIQAAKAEHWRAIQTAAGVTEPALKTTNSTSGPWRPGVPPLTLR